MIAELQIASAPSAELQIAPATEVQRRLFTIEEYDRLYEAGILTEDDRVEFLDGELIVMSTIGPRHVGCIAWLTRFVVDATGPDYLVGIQNPFRIDRRADFLPDVVIYRAAGKRNRVPKADEIVLLIEIADSSRKYDRNVKFPRYAEVGIPEAWLVDYVDDRLERHTEPQGGAYRRVVSVGRGERLPSTIFPAMVFDVDEVLGSPEDEEGE